MNRELRRKIFCKSFDFKQETLFCLRHRPPQSTNCQDMLEVRECCGRFPRGCAYINQSWFCSFNTVSYQYVFTNFEHLLSFIKRTRKKS